MCQWCDGKCRVDLVSAGAMVWWVCQCVCGVVSTTTSTESALLVIDVGASGVLYCTTVLAHHWQLEYTP